MYKLKTEDLITQTLLADHQTRSSRIHQDPLGFYVYHKPSDTEVQITHHKTVHKNKTEAMIILEDLLTPIAFKSKGYLVLPIDNEIVHRVLDRWEFFYDMFVPRKERELKISSTIECAKYLARINIKKSLDELDKERDNLTKQLKELY